MGPIPDDAFPEWWLAVILVVGLLLLIIGITALVGYGHWIVKGDPPKSTLVRTQMALVLVGSAVGLWTVGVATVLDPNSGPFFWAWIWPAIIAGAVGLSLFLWRQHKTPHT